MPKAESRLRIVDSVIIVKLKDPTTVVRTLAGSAGKLLLMTMDRRESERQATFGAFRRQIEPAYELLLPCIVEHDPMLSKQPNVKAAFLHSLSVDFLPTKGQIHVHVCYCDLTYERTYHIHFEAENREFLDRIPTLAQPDDKPHQRLPVHL